MLGYILYSLATHCTFVIVLMFCLYLQLSVMFQHIYDVFLSLSFSINPGICHQCRAGQCNIPFEDFFSREPKWYPTLHEQPPWDSPTSMSSFCSLPHAPGEEAGLFAWDLFHSLHLGVAKTHVSSTLAALSDLEEGTTVDARFQALAEDYAEWRKSGSYLKVNITKDFIGWRSRNDYPCGSWHKGATTTSLRKYLEARLGLMDLSGNRLLQMAFEATVAINRSTKLLYEHGEVFLGPAAAESIGELGLRFLRRYASLAKGAHDEQRSLWSIIPKCHALHHIYLTLVKQAAAGKLSLSPLCHGTQQDEDYTGRPSRISRRVDVRLATRRVVQCYLASAYDKYVAEGFIVTSAG